MTPVRAVPRSDLRDAARVPPDRLSGIPTYSAERRTMVVAAISAATMVAEIAGGAWFGSMALLADGLHMGAHTFALGIAALAYAYARRHAENPRFAFGTGKVNALGGYTGAVLLGLSAVWIVWESLGLLWRPVSVRYGEALFLATIGLIVNMVCAVALRDDGSGKQGHSGCRHAHDHNLRAAYLHVAADAVTSALAIVALFAAQRFALPWLDPLVGMVGGVVVGWWAIGLLRSSSAVLLDHQGPGPLQEAIRRALEEDGERIADLRCWAVAPERYAVAVCLQPGISRSIADHKRALLRDDRVAWTTIEVL